MYSELVYFEGAYFAHIVARDEHHRLQRLNELPRRLIALTLGQAGNFDIVFGTRSL